MDDEKVLNETQEDVVDSQTEAVEETENTETVDVAEESEKEQEVAEPVEETQQNKEENAIYAKMRRKAEEEVKQKYEVERQKIEQERIKLEQLQLESKVMSEVANPQAVQNFAYEEGVSEEFARQLLTARAKEKIVEEKERVRQRNENIKRTKDSLRKEAFFNELEADLDKMISANPDIDIKTAYKFLKGDKFDELMSNREKTAEKRAIANVQDNLRRRNIGSSEYDSTSTEGLSDFAKSFNAFAGIDSREVAKHVKNRKKEK